MSLLQNKILYRVILRNKNVYRYFFLNPSLLARLDPLKLLREETESNNKKLKFHKRYWYIYWNIITGTLQPIIWLNSRRKETGIKLDSHYTKALPVPEWPRHWNVSYNFNHTAAYHWQNCTEKILPVVFQ